MTIPDCTYPLLVTAAAFERRWEHGQLARGPHGDFYVYCDRRLCEHDRRQDAPPVHREDVDAYHWWNPRTQDHYRDTVFSGPPVPLLTPDEVAQREKAAAAGALRDAATARHDDLDYSTQLWLEKRADAIEAQR